MEGVNHPLLESLNLNSEWSVCIYCFCVRTYSNQCFAFSDNEITEISGLDPDKLCRLHTLELRGNQLESTAGINLPNLKNLFIVNFWNANVHLNKNVVHHLNFQSNRRPIKSNNSKVFKTCKAWQRCTFVTTSWKSWTGFRNKWRTYSTLTLGTSSCSALQAHVK